MKTMQAFAIGLVAALFAMNAQAQQATVDLGNGHKIRANANGSAEVNVPGAKVRANAGTGTSQVRTPGAWVQASTTGRGAGKCEYTNQDLSGRNFANANLAGCTFTNVDLSGANMQNAQFINVELEGTNLSGAVLIGARFTNTDINAAITTGAAR